MNSLTAAFGKDLISLPKLLEMVVIPFLKVAMKINASPSEVQQADAVMAQFDLRNVLLEGWKEGLITLVDGGMMVNGDVEGPLVFASLTSSNKRAEVLRALLDTGFFKVC